MFNASTISNILVKIIFVFFCLVNQFKRGIGNRREELIVSEQCDGIRCGEKYRRATALSMPLFAEIIIPDRRNCMTEAGKPLCVLTGTESSGPLL